MMFEAESTNPIVLGCYQGSKVAVFSGLAVQIDYVATPKVPKVYKYDI